MQPSEPSICFGTSLPVEPAEPFLQVVLESDEEGRRRLRQVFIKAQDHLLLRLAGLHAPCSTARSARQAQQRHSSGATECVGARGGAGWLRMPRLSSSAVCCTGRRRLAGQGRSGLFKSMLRRQGAAWQAHLWCPRALPAAPPPLPCPLHAAPRTVWPAQDPRQKARLCSQQAGSLQAPLLLPVATARTH